MSQISSIISQLQQAVASLRPPRQSIGVNLEGIGLGMRGLLFADAMLQAQEPYAGHDAAYQPTADMTEWIVSTGCTPSMAGTYEFVCNGQPVLRGNDSSYLSFANQQYVAATDTTTADATVTAEQLQVLPQIAFGLTNVVAGKVRNVQLWRPGCVPGGGRWNPAFLSLVAPFDRLRFMDALGTNTSAQTDWSQRALPTDRNYSMNGMCYEDCFALCRASGKTPWVNVPAQASPAYLASLLLLAQQCYGGPYYLEWGNELWNQSFLMWAWCVAQATADKTLQYDGTTDPNILLWRWMASRTAQVGQAAMQLYGATDVRDTPVRPVFAGQWGNPSVLQYGLQHVATKYGPPAQYGYCGAFAPYAVLSSAMQQRVNSGDATVTAAEIAQDYLTTGAYDDASNDSLTQQNCALIEQAGLHVDLYEVGLDAGQAQQDVAQKTAAAHLAAAGQVVTLMTQNAWGAGIESLCWYDLTYPESSSGQWGLTNDTYDQSATTQPKYAALVAAARATRSTR